VNKLKKLLQENNNEIDDTELQDLNLMTLQVTSL